MPPIDVLVVDLDGTLLSSRGRVSAANRAALDRARSEGIEVVIASGRTLSECKPTLEAIEHTGAVIAAGGSLLCDAVTGRTHERRVVAAEVVGTVAIAIAEHHRVLVLKDAHATGYDYLLVGDAPLDKASEWWLETLPIQFREADRHELDEHPEDTLRVGAVAAADVLAPLADSLLATLEGLAHLQHWPAVAESVAIGSPTHLLEVFGLDVNKWTMLQHFCNEHDVPNERVAAVGDGLNDIELVGNAGTGIAMANADPRVLDAADHVVGHHDEDGFAQAVEWLLG